MTAPHSFDLNGIAGHQLAELGARIRRCSEGRAATLDEISRAMVDVLWDSLNGGSPSQLALVRLFRTSMLGALPRELREACSSEQLPDETRCLVLRASRGIEPAWNDINRSVAYRAIPFSDTGAMSRAPMIVELVHDLGLDRQDDARQAQWADRVFFVPDAIGSEHVPAQRDFVLRYGVRAVIGFGGVLPDREGFACVLFARASVAADVAGLFSTLALHAGIALSGATDLITTAADRDRECVAAYERLLRLQESLYIEQVTALAHAGAAEAMRAASLAETLEREQTAGSIKVQRVQRAMLNVIEDLREARGDLERKVAARTAELAKANEELSASNSELEQFAYIASHDLQEPLRTIGGYIQLLQERYGDRIDADGHEFISYAVRGVQRMQQLIEALLAYSRIACAPIELGAVSLDRTFDEVLQAMARSIKESHAVIDCAPLPVVKGDALQLRQLFQNLLSNAIKFAGAAAPRVEVHAERRGSEVEITFRDHGIGFDPKYAEQVFKVFRRLQRKLPGTGIGLAICKKITERHGGGIRAMASPGSGATFHVTLKTSEPA